MADAIDELLSPEKAAIFRRIVAKRDQLRRMSPKSPILDEFEKVVTELIDATEAWAEIYAGASVH
jgi:hypothetical protein